MKNAQLRLLQLHLQLTDTYGDVNMFEEMELVTNFLEGPLVENELNGCFRPEDKAE